MKNNLFSNRLLVLYCSFILIFATPQVLANGTDNKIDDAYQNVMHPLDDISQYGFDQTNFREIFKRKHWILTGASVASTNHLSPMNPFFTEKMMVEPSIIWGYMYWKPESKLLFMFRGILSMSGWQSGRKADPQVNQKIDVFPTRFSTIGDIGVKLNTSKRTKIGITGVLGLTVSPMRLYKASDNSAGESQQKKEEEETKKNADYKLVVPVILGLRLTMFFSNSFDASNVGEYKRLTAGIHCISLVYSMNPVSFRIKSGETPNIYGNVYNLFSWHSPKISLEYVYGF